MRSPRKHIDGNITTPNKENSPIKNVVAPVAIPVGTYASPSVGFHRQQHQQHQQQPTVAKPRKTINTVFANKKFFFDLKAKNLNSPWFKQLASDLKTLGGTIETFFSRDVTTVISDAPESKLSSLSSRNPPGAAAAANDLASPNLPHAMGASSTGPSTPGGLAPSPCTSVSLPGAANSPWSPVSIEEAKKLPVVRSRADAILDRARQQNARCGPSGDAQNGGGISCSNYVLDFAKQWRLQVWSLAKLVDWLDKFKKRCTAASRRGGGGLHPPHHETPPMTAAARAAFIQTRSQSVDSGLQTRPLVAPYIKFEVTNHMYEPVFQEFKRFPKIFFCGRQGQSPFTMPDIFKQRNRQRLREERTGNRGIIFNQQRGLEMNARNLAHHQQPVLQPPHPTAATTATTATTATAAATTTIVNRRHNQGGFCEICECPFTDLYDHLSSKIHQHRVSGNEMWAKLDELFAQINQSEEDEFDPQYSF